MNFKGGYNMTGRIIITAMDDKDVAELAAREGREMERGFSVDTEVKHASRGDLLGCMAALGDALHLEKTDWLMLSLMMLDIGPVKMDSLNISIPKNNAGEEI